MNLGREFELHDFHIGRREDTEYSLWLGLDVKSSILIGCGDGGPLPTETSVNVSIDHVIDVVQLLGRAATIPSFQGRKIFIPISKRKNTRVLSSLTAHATSFVLFRPTPTSPSIGEYQKSTQQNVCICVSSIFKQTMSFDHALGDLGFTNLGGVYSSYSFMP